MRRVTWSLHFSSGALSKKSLTINSIFAQPHVLSTFELSSYHRLHSLHVVVTFPQTPVLRSMTEYLTLNILRPLLKQWHHMVNIDILAAGATWQLLSLMSRRRKWREFWIFLEAGCHKLWIYVSWWFMFLLQCFYFSSLIFFWTWILQ